ncbi:hypothetical protein GJAV_G00121840 [Gymnothorax javanicus]|nr:hypothetical protein GJAV_G00121840 [Gymnothorax javanicus]
MHLQNLAQRRRSAPSLALGRALGKTWSLIRQDGIGHVPAEECPFVLGLTSENAELALEERVQLTEGLKTKERQLFLFSDILVIAKLKASCSSYRLKHKVNLEELWIVTFKDEDDDDEGDMGIDLKTSLLIAWPLAHCVVSFRSREIKQHWLNTLHRKIREATERSGSLSSPPSVLMTVLSGSITCKTPGGGMNSVIELPTHGDVCPPQKEEPLHNAESGNCHPIESTNTGRWRLFMKKKLRENSSHSRNAPSTDLAHCKALLFGQQLSKVCPSEDELPKPITDMLQLLLKKGMFTEGVFRKTANARSMREIRDQLNSGAEVELESKPVTLLAALVKDFLRQIPGSLLMVDRYEDWMNAFGREDIQDKHAQLRQVIDRLPPANGMLLQLLLCVLHHISRNTATNKMDAKNLAICIAPNLLLHQSEDTEMVSKVTDLTQFLIENCCGIFGDQILSLLGDPEEEELADNLDSLSSHQHDSAYDSTDPDAEGDSGDPAVGGLGARSQDKADSNNGDGPNFRALPRRSSEPVLFSSAVATGNRLRGLARSHDDFLGAARFATQPLKKPASEESVLLSAPLARPNAAKRPDGSCSSTCSLESSFSNQSEGSVFTQPENSTVSTQSESSVFTSSPLASPVGSRKSLLPRHMSFHLDSPSPSPLPAQPEKEVKRRTQSMRNAVKTRVKSWSTFTRVGSLKKGESQKDGPSFPCETLQEDLQSEAGLGGQASADRLRPRPLSAVEVFRQVDSRIAAHPPSYEPTLPLQYRALTVRDARELKMRSRPSSVSEELLFQISHPQDLPTLAVPTDIPILAPLRPTPRSRAMSESVPRGNEKINRRFSQPVFEELPYAKESYV